MATATVTVVRASTASLLLRRTTQRSSAIGFSTRRYGVAAAARATTATASRSYRRLDSRRRCFCGGGAPPPPPPPPAGGDGDDSPREGEQERFVVTGSLLDARRAGADSPLPGQFLSLSHAFDAEAVAAFAAHAGDNNPIHLDEEHARQAGPRSYDGCIVHGLMVAGLFSTAFGRAISGALYVSQSLRFERPVLVGESVDVRIEVERARVTSSGREVLVRCATLASLADGTVAVSGQAKVLLPRTCEVRSW